MRFRLTRQPSLRFLPPTNGERRTMPKPRILLQFDPDHHASSFDAVVAIDADVDHLLQYSGVEVNEVEALVHGAIFTRGPQDLPSTAIFIGGTDVRAGEALLERVKQTFFGPMRVSVMLDANGANTTAVAAVLAAKRHADLTGAEALVLAGTGPVGQRAALLLAGQGANVRLASRRLDRAQAVCETIAARIGDRGSVRPVATSTDDETRAAMQDVQVVIAAGAAGVTLLPQAIWSVSQSLQVAIDLNAVPPLGIEGIGVMARAEQVSGGVTAYGAIGVGATKMRVHKAALQRLFEDNSAVLDAEEIFQLGLRLEP